MSATAEKMPTSRKSSEDILGVLDGVITISDVSILMEIPRQQASVYLNRWNASGKVEMFSQGVYFNLVKDPDGIDANLGLALEKLLGKSFVVIGGSAVYHGGWTTQINTHIEVATPVYRGSMSVPKTFCGVTIVPRRQRRFDALMEHINDDASGWDRVPVLKPAAAIVDALIAKGVAVQKGKGPDVHDIPVDEIDIDYVCAEDVDEISRVAVEMGHHAMPFIDKIEAYKSGLLACVDDDLSQDMR